MEKRLTDLSIDEQRECSICGDVFPVWDIMYESKSKHEVICTECFEKLSEKEKLKYNYRFFDEEYLKKCVYDAVMKSKPEDLKKI